MEAQTTEWTTTRERMLEECWEAVTINYQLALKLAWNEGWEAGLVKGQELWEPLK